jgi:hypothetical protein
MGALFERLRDSLEQEAQATREQPTVKLRINFVKSDEIGEPVVADTMEREFRMGEASILCDREK